MMYKENQTEAIGLMNEILDYVERFDRPKSDWIFGITDDKGRRLFKEHSVVPGVDKYIVLPSSKSETSKLLEEFLTDKVLGGFDGAPGGDTQGRFVYAYMKEPHTKQ